MRLGMMALVIALFFAVYGGLHVYVYTKFHALFLARRWLLITALALLCLSVLAVEALAHAGVAPAAVVPLASVAYVWMGVVFLFITLSLAVDLVAALARVGDAAMLQQWLSAPTRSIVVGVAALIVTTYGLIAAHNVVVERVTLTTTKLAAPLRIAQISDLHLGVLTNAQHVQRLVSDVNGLAPDVIVMTGDLVDMQMDHFEKFGAVLAQLQAPRGKYAVFGNHEVFAGLAGARAFIERAGFRLLSNAGVVVNDVITIVGVDDPAVQGLGATPDVAESTLLAQYSSQRYTVLLKHQPIVEPDSRGRFDLQLSGHTHGGQIFPFGLLTKTAYRAPMGLSSVAPDSWLYVSRGSGTWGPPMRVLAPPEIAVIELVPQAAP